MSQAIVKDLGPCEVTFNTTNLGQTKGDVVFRYSTEARDIFEDSKGTFPVDSILIGGACEVEVPLTRTTLAQLASIIPGATISSYLMSVSSPVGTSMFNNAAELILKPYDGGSVSADAKTFLKVPKAFPRADMEIIYNIESQRVFKAIFVGFADTNGLVWTVGE